MFNSKRLTEPLTLYLYPLNPATPDLNSKALPAEDTEINDIEKHFNEEDENDILTDQDQLGPLDNTADIQGAKSTLSPDLENEPEEFQRGEIDVKTQIDRTTRIARANIQGHHDLDDSPATTPGGIEEVAAQTDEEMAERGLSKKDIKKLLRPFQLKLHLS